MEKKIHQVGSIGEICSILKHADRSVEQEFVLSDDASLSDARKVWKLVNTEEGGYGVLANPALLSSKEDAYQFVDKRIEGLRRLVRNSDRLHTNLTASTQHLEAVLEEGGPGLQASYDPKVFHEACPFIDTDQVRISCHLRGEEGVCVLGGDWGCQICFSICFGGNWRGLVSAGNIGEGSEEAYPAAAGYDPSRGWIA